ncbi:monovalent cation/H+ antiporter complex subunit F [Motiliproteus sediminis]|uniref:monovalent cation/H+ antiporter complex subunit F n=1 Tax=Motiliproteus sediminis TaxID=1468178 RepID=UPI001AF02035|nr:monovalent cation/H+ antiporter complex subunit F [Motiliproteus sediminis]
MSASISTLLLAALLVLVGVISVALIRLLLSRTLGDQFLCIQLLGTGGTGILLLLGTLLQQPALTDVALILALLASVTVMAITQRRSRDS